MNRYSFITDLTPEELNALVLSMGGRPFHGKNLSAWVFRRGVRTFEEMSDLPKALRMRLEEAYRIHRLEETRRLTSRDGTARILYRLPDGNTVETVDIPEGNRRTLCLSTQVGCAMGCRFCASSLAGLKRNLTSGEMVEQVLHALRSGARVTNLVFMGVGEPLMNLRNLARALETMNRFEGLGLGARRITVSTVGLPDRIRRLADLGLQVNLAVSLHAATEEKRRHLIPAAKKISTASILEAADHYRTVTTRDVTFEVLLLGGVNDGREDAEALARLLGERKCYVNIIPFNPVPSLPYGPPTPKRVAAFRDILEQSGVPAAVRRPRGRDIEAACGQLRLRHLQND